MAKSLGQFNQKDSEFFEVPFRNLPANTTMTPVHAVPYRKVRVSMHDLGDF